MSVNCGPSFGVCAVRLTRVNADGSVIAGANSYVTDKPISVAVAPNYETGNTFSQRNGCGCGIARLKAPDTFNWFDITFTEAALEPVMQAFLLGAGEIEDGFDTVGELPGPARLRRRRARRRSGVLDAAHQRLLAGRPVPVDSLGVPHERLAVG